MAPKLDRLIEFDERSKLYPIRTLVEDKPLRSYTWRVPVALDQGNEGACVGFAWAHEAAARPVVVPGVTNQFARDIYHNAQLVDQWPGEAYEGTSVIAGARTMHDWGYIDEYRWAFSENDLALAVGYKGPAVLGTYWYAGMDRPDADGYLRPIGGVRGGHAYLAYGYSIKKPGYKIWNSWGTGHYGWIHPADMALLLSQQGEAAIPIKRSQAGSA